jgi:hypothetical protein
MIDRRHRALLPTQQKSSSGCHWLAFYNAALLPYKKILEKGHGRFDGHFIFLFASCNSPHPR